MDRVIPKNYQEWVNYLKLLEKNQAVILAEEEFYESALAEDAETIRRFEHHLAETVNVMLNRYVKRFVKNINEALEMNEPDSLLFLIRRFKNQMNHCLFFRNIRFLPKEFQAELEENIHTQISEVFGKIMKELYKIQEESQNPELEDLLYSVRRIRIFETGGKDGKLQYDKTGS